LSAKPSSQFHMPLPVGAESEPAEARKS